MLGGVTMAHAHNVFIFRYRVLSEILIMHPLVCKTIILHHMRHIMRHIDPAHFLYQLERAYPA